MNITTLNMTTLDGGVIIKKGGGGTPTPPSGGSTIEYFLYSKGNAAGVSTYAQYVKIVAMEGALKAIMPYSPTANGLLTHLDGDIVAFGLDLNERVVLVQDDIIRDVSILDTLAENGITREDIDAIPRLTKEQFYSLD